MKTNLSSIIEQISKIRGVLTSKIPYKLEKVDTGYKPDVKDDKIFLVYIDGATTEVEQVEKDGDSMTLTDGDKHIALTSNPLVINGTQLYFTKNGFKGTMALNRDTLLAGDVYNPSKSTVKLKKPDNLDIEQVDGLTEDSIIEENGKEFIQLKKGEDMGGDIISLEGSKRTLKRQNEAERLRKILTPQGLDRQTLLMSLGAGASIGFIIANYMGGA